jgi:hypothetical protein
MAKCRGQGHHGAALLQMLDDRLESGGRIPRAERRLHCACAHGHCGQQCENHQSLRLLEQIARDPHLLRSGVRRQPIRSRHPRSAQLHLPARKHELECKFRIGQKPSLCIALQQQNG